MCENCSEFQQLLYRVDWEREDNLAVLNNEDELGENYRASSVGKDDVLIALSFLNIWHQKPCMCVFREDNNIETVTQVVQLITKIALKKLCALPLYLVKLFGVKKDSLEKHSDKDAKSRSPAKPPEKDEDDEDLWSLEDTERLLTFMSRVFMLQFPLYLAAKQAGSHLDDLSDTEATSLAVFFDVSGDVADIPLLLLRNVAMFCRSGGLLAMMTALKLSPALLPTSTAHVLVSILCNLKLWLSSRAVKQLFAPVRTAALAYLCRLTDGELRQQQIQPMADFLWLSSKDTLDSPLQLDKEGLELALKYFSSPTLTMRLCGINQVNAHISLLNEVCSTEELEEVESVGMHLAQWIIQNRLLDHIFGPNLHVEVIKQSHVLFNFLAMEGKITDGHMDTIWQAAQLKHCSKQVLDILLPLIKHLEAGPVHHLYELAQRLPVKEHTEQTIYLAQVLQEFIWSRGGFYSQTRASVDSQERECMEKTVTVCESSDDDISDDLVIQDFVDLDEMFSDVDEDDDTSSSCDPKSSELDSSRDINSSLDLDTSVESSEIKSPQKSLRSPSDNFKKVNITSYINKKQPGAVKRRIEAKINDSVPELELSMDRGGGESAVSTKKLKLEPSVKNEDATQTNDNPSAKIVGLPTPVPASGPSSLKPDMSTGPIMKEFKPDRLQGKMFDAIGDGGSGGASSHVSNKSEKNMDDFADEYSADEEIVRLAQTEQLGSIHHHHRHLASMAQFYQSQLAAPQFSGRQQREGAKVLAPYRMDGVAERGNTLLWDLIQDGNIEHLADGVAAEAEKALTNLLCYNVERYVRIKFIEGCLANLKKNVSVVVSLRLLSQLFQSFHNSRSMDIHEITLRTERKHNMTKLFFDNLQAYTAERRAGSVHLFYPHTVQIQVRLHFLALLFSHSTSPDQFRLSEEHVSILWECLARDPVSSDDLFQWLLEQSRSKEQHALDINSVKYIYSEKLPELRPETITMTGLNLLSQLSTILRISETGQQVTDASANMDQLWKIALQATNTDVSMKAIQLLNGAYLGHGEQFLSTCMRRLQQDGDNLSGGEDQLVRIHREDQLVRIHRAILLLKSHLETFRRKYAYQFRRLAIQGQPVKSHAELVEVRQSGPLRIVVQLGGAITEKVTLDMNFTDLVGDLRAEIGVWWEGKLGGEHDCSTLLGSLQREAHTHLRLISKGQEISPDFDEKTLADLGFKDLQIVFASMGSGPSRGGIVSGTGDLNPELPPFPGRDKIPMLLLLQPAHFEQLFSLMSKLSSITTTQAGVSHPVLDTKAQMMSRRVWDILLLLPTSPEIKQGLQDIDINSDLSSLLDTQSPHKLLYIFSIIEWLGRLPRDSRHSGLHEKVEVTESPRPGSAASEAPTGWVNQFVHSGGLKHLLDILISGILGRRGTPVWCEWKQDCSGALLRLLLLFGVDSSDADTEVDQLADATTTKKKCYKSNRTDRLLVPTLSPIMIDLMDIERVMPKLGEVFLDLSSPTSRENIEYCTGVFGRSEIVGLSMSLLVSWLYSAPPHAENALFNNSQLATWLRTLLLEDHDPAVRREMCTGIYRMCLGSSSSGRNGQSCIKPMLSVLLEFLEDAQLMKPQRSESVNQPEIPIDKPGKEMFGPTCSDYFRVLCRLVENLKMSEDNDKLDMVDIDQLTQTLVRGISDRPILERRMGGASQPDDALIGMLNLMSAVLKHSPNFKQHQEGAEFVGKLFSFLFALSSPTERMYPKCKSTMSRSACYDLMIEMVRGSLSNYTELHRLVLAQHQSSAHKPYPWEYWPCEEGRNECGYVGLTNLGATCYMATCVQQLYMIPALRTAVLRNHGNFEDNFGKHLNTLQELKKMFAYLMESERKAYKPLSFCKTYQMDHQPLNTREQKDMAEFFIDLLSKMEEMTPDLKKTVKSLFCGTLSNYVVSLDCGHVSSSTEEFYTVRCQVAEMKNLNQSLEEVCVKDMLEGDNMYTCSQCGTKVRAEKRACFKELPEILAFNTMRYSFNMVSMMKEKVNTHFSFPFRLDMAPYMEHNLISKKVLTEQIEYEKSCEYELIGVTVHTGTANGGHYYAFIKDRTSVKDNWYSFNDAEVKQFDPNQIASECFGGEMSSRTYDQVTDKFLDVSIEKTNSAYMLFYERAKRSGERKECASSKVGPGALVRDDWQSPSKQLATLDLSGELLEWIWQDNRSFIQDNNIFDHTYFNFMWQMVGFLPTTLNQQQQDGAGQDLTLLSAKLTTTFFWETFIHAKEKQHIVQWVELLSKQLDCSAPACTWFLQHMSSDSHWPVTIFLKCKIATIRQMFHRLVIRVIQKLRPTECESYLLPWQPAHPDDHPEPGVHTKIGLRSPVTRFVRMLLHLLKAGTAKSHHKHLTELFSFLHDFAKLGDQEAEFLLSVQTITICVEFYLETVHCDVKEAEILSDEDDDDEDIIVLPLGGSDKAAARTASFGKMVTLLAVLVEKSRGDDNFIHLSEADYASLTSGKSLLFLYNITSDNINIRQTCNLIVSLTRHNPTLAKHIVEMVFLGVKSPEHSINFFRLLTFLTELPAEPADLPCYTELIMRRVWDLATSSPQAALDWLSIHVTRNQEAQTCLLNSMDDWVEQYLIGHTDAKVRNSAAFLLVSLVPTTRFRETFRTSPTPPSQLRDAIAQTTGGLDVIKQILQFLLSLLKSCKLYVDMNCHGTTKLVSFFQVMTHFLLSKTEKQLLGPYFQDLWDLFHPKLSEQSVPVHQNKQALLHFWYTATLDCVDNAKLIVNNPNVAQNIVFNYILADHENTEVVNFNRIMLPTYYGLLRLCCSQSRSFCRTLAQHQNIQWAFKNISPYSTKYSVAVDELMKLMTLFVAKFSDSSEEELQEIQSFRTTSLQLYLSILDGRSSWQTLITVLSILIDSTEDKVLTVCNNGLSLIYDAFNFLHLMHHEATACHVTHELKDLLTIFIDLVRTVRAQSHTTELRLIVSGWKNMADMTSRLLTLCNSFSPHDLREVCLTATKEMLMVWPTEMLSVLVPMLRIAHVSAADTESTLLGPYFPQRKRRGTPLPSAKSVRPPRPMLELSVPDNQLEAPHGQDPEYDIALKNYFWTYHNLVDLMVRLAVNKEAVNKQLIDLSTMVGLDGVHLHFQLFPKLWLDISGSKNIERGTLKAIIALLLSSHGLLEYLDAVLLDERSSLNNQYVFQFLCVFFPKVADQVLTDQVKSLIHDMCNKLIAAADTFDLTRLSAVMHLIGDFRALLLVHSGVPDIKTPELKVAVQTLKERLTEQSALLGEAPSSESKTQTSPKYKEMDHKETDSEDVGERRKSVDSDTDLETKIESKRRSSEESIEKSSCEKSSKRSCSETRRGSSDDPTRRGSHSSKSHIERLRKVYAALGLSIQCLLKELDKRVTASQDGCDYGRPTKESSHISETEESSPSVVTRGKVAERMETNEKKDLENVDLESEGEGGKRP